jgi:hypothetical protein
VDVDGEGVCDEAKEEVGYEKEGDRLKEGDDK